MATLSLSLEPLLLMMPFLYRALATGACINNACIKTIAMYIQRYITIYALTSKIRVGTHFAMYRYIPLYLNVGVVYANTCSNYARF